MTEWGSRSIETSPLVSAFLDPTPAAAFQRLPPSEALSEHTERAISRRVTENAKKADTDCRRFAQDAVAGVAMSMASEYKSLMQSRRHERGKTRKKKGLLKKTSPFSRFPVFVLS